MAVNYTLPEIELEVNVNLDRLFEKYNSAEVLTDAIERGVRKGIEEFCDRLEQKLLGNLSKYGLADSDLANSIVVTPMEGGVELTVGAEYGMYVEYGTGIVGASSPPHPKPEGWQHDVKNHGDKGWQYIGKDGKLHWTKGQPSRPFMYETWLWGTRSCSNIVQKHIRRELKKLGGVS